VEEGVKGELTCITQLSQKVQINCSESEVFKQLQSKRPEGLLDSNQKSMGIYAYLSIAHTNTERQSFATSLKAFRLLTEQGFAASNPL
jgi:hypothetical protein